MAERHEHLDGKKLFIGIPNSQHVVPSLFFWSVIGIKQIIPSVVKRSGVSTGIIRNNILIRAFLDSDCDYFIKLDVDQTYPPDYFEVMVPLIEKYKCIGPLIFDRWEESRFAPLVFVEPREDAKWMKLDDPVEALKRRGIEERKFSHSNLFLHRKVLEAIPPPWYNIAISDDGMEKMYHGDRYFVNNITKAGYKLYINYDVVVKHITEVEIDRGVHKKWAK